MRSDTKITIALIGAFVAAVAVVSASSLSAIDSQTDSLEADISAACALRGVEVSKGSLVPTRTGGTISVSVDGGAVQDAHLKAKGNSVIITVASGEDYTCVVPEKK